MKKYIFSLVCLCCALLPALEGQAALHEHPEYPELRKSDANIVGHILDKNTKEHLPYITIALKGTTIGTVTDVTGHYFLKNLPEGNFVLEVSSVGYKTVRRNVTLKKGHTLEEDFEIEEDAVALDGVVVSANRNETTRRLAPTLVNVVDLKIFEKSNSTTLAQGLSLWLPAGTYQWTGRSLYTNPAGFSSYLQCTFRSIWHRTDSCQHD